MALQSNIFSTWSSPQVLPVPRIHSKALHVRCRSSIDGQEEYLIDAPVSAGDGFSFTGGKYSDGPSRADEWFAQGKIIKAHPVYSSRGKAKDPIFGLKMGAESQSSDDVFRASQKVSIKELLGLSKKPELEEVQNFEYIES